MDIVAGRSRILCDGTSSRLPICHVVCNQTPPMGEKPSPMTIRECSKKSHSKLISSLLSKLISSVFRSNKKVRRASKAEVGERKDWVIDALNATRAAVKEGIVPDSYSFPSRSIATKEVTSLKVTSFETRNATRLFAPAITVGLGALTHRLGTLVPVIVASGFATAATAIGTVVGSFR